MSSLEVSNTNSKYCVYGCNTKIYWNTLNSEYVEVSTKKKHSCPNRSVNNQKSESNATINNNNISSKPAAYYQNNHLNNYNSKNN